MHKRNNNDLKIFFQSFDSDLFSSVFNFSSLSLKPTTCRRCKQGLGGGVETKILTQKAPDWISKAPAAARAADKAEAPIC